MTELDGSTRKVSLRALFQRSRGNRRRNRVRTVERLETRHLLAASLFRLNAGGPALSDSPDWSADTVGDPAIYANVAEAGNKAASVATAIDMSDGSIPAGTPEELFKTRRWDPETGTDLQYAFPVAPGDYQVRLYFAETWHQYDAPGERVFDVSIEGSVALDDYDIFAATGARWKGIVESFTVTADASLDIALQRVVNTPTIGAIEIIQLANAENSPPVLEAIGTQTVSEGNVLTVPVTASDPNAGQSLTFSTENLPSFVSFSDNGDGSGLLRIAPAVGELGDYSATLTVTDTGSPALSDSETVAIRVTAANASPVLDPIGAITATSGETLIVPLSASDADSEQTLSFSAADLPDYVTLVDNGDGTALLQISPAAADAGTTATFAVAVADDATPSGSDFETISLTISSSSTTAPLYRINAGGQNVAGSPVWAVDTQANPSDYWNAVETGNASFATAAPIDLADPSVPSGTPEGIFQTSRFDAAADPAMQWEFPVTAGQYEVRLFFAETFGGAMTEGARQFDVSIEGITVLADYDIFAEVGGNAGTVKTFRFVTDETIDVDFAHVVENPTINAIEISQVSFANSAPVLATIAPQSVVEGETLTVSVSAADADAGQTLALTASGLPSFAVFVDDGNGSGTLTISPGAGDAGLYELPTIIATDDGTPALSDSESFIIHVLAADAGAGTVYRVNAGGDSVEDDFDWLADTKSAPSPYVNAGATGNKTTLIGATVDTSHGSIPAGTPMALFQSERWDPGPDPELHWSFPVTPGGYEVRLFFAETYAQTQAVGQRVFDVYIEDELKLDDYDIFAAVGGYKGVMESFVVTADEMLDIRFGHMVENPAIKAIEILRLQSSAETLRASSAAVNFGAVEPGSTATRALKLTNGGLPGDPDVTITGSTLSGDAAFDASFSSVLPITLAPGESTTATLTFAPEAEQNYSGSLTIAHSGNESPLTIPLAGIGGVAAIDFGKSTLAGTSLTKPTSLQFGPDGRLYVAQQEGEIDVYTIEKQGANDFAVTATETILSVQQIPNHNDDGTPNLNINQRLITGLLVTGTAAHPVLYVGSSDPRIGAGPSGEDLNLDTNSGVISRLTWNGSSWEKLDLVRGLPRSEENHAINGLQLDESTNTLYVAIGGNTNMGAPSNNFALLPEFALSAAILAVDLDAIGDTTYDLPTLDDEDRDNALDNEANPTDADINDPFGGNDGKNQAKLVPGGPVTVYSPGWRNPYDILLTQDGRMYSIDNGPNAGWGDIPIKIDGVATNQVSEPGVSFKDGLHLVSGEGYYAGHPNPTRASQTNTFNSSNPQSSISVDNPVESDYLPPVNNSKYPGRNDSLTQFGASTNGLVEYTATNFGGQMQGDLLTVAFDNSLKRVVLNAAGDQVESSTNLFSNVGGAPLDVTALGNESLFPGTIWVADWYLGKIVVFDPMDASEGCPGDADCDGYSDEDEIANGTNPSLSADVPPDFDSDFISDLLDDDDDNDAILDVEDLFAVDADNGATTPIGTMYTWENDETSGGLLNLGFTGLMNNGSDDYLGLYDPDEMTAGGAAGVLTIDAASSGTALGAINTQKQALQFGFNAGASNGTFVAKTSVGGPFAGVTPEAGTEFGFYVGTGDQDNYTKLVISGDNGGEIQFVSEISGVPATIAVDAVSLADVNFIDLDLIVDPLALTVTPRYRVNIGGVDQPAVTMAASATIPAAWVAEVMAVGLISTDATPETSIPVTWNFLGVIPGEASSIPPRAQVEITKTGGINASTFPLKTMSIANTAAAGGPKIASVSFDISNALLPDLVFDPAGTGGDLVARALTVSSGAEATGFIAPTNPAVDPFSVPYQGGYRVMTLGFTDFDPGELLEFAVDIDPTSIQGLDGEGSDWPGSVSGLEMTGMRITVTYDDGSTHTGEVFSIDGSNLSQGSATIKSSPAAAPTVQVVGIAPTPNTVTEPEQTVQVAAAPGQTVRLMVAEAALESGVFDIDPYEANTVVGVQKFSAVVGSSGVVEFDVTLARSQADGGFNHIVAVVEEADGSTGLVSDVLVVQLTDGYADNPPFVEQNGLIVIETESLAATDGWAFESAVSGFTGEGYYRWNDANILDQKSAGSKGLIEYRLSVTNPGTYQFRIHNYRPSGSGDSANDLWIRLNNGVWEKVFTTASGDWNWTTRFDRAGETSAASFELPAGTHSFFIAGRSRNYHADRMVFFDLTRTGYGQAQRLSTPESERHVSGTDSAENSGNNPGSLDYDVNADGKVSPLDALVVINVLNRSGGSGEGEFGIARTNNRVDVNRDGKVSPIDALIVLNRLNRSSLGTTSLSAVPVPQVTPFHPTDLDDEEDRLAATDAAIDAWLDELDRLA